MPARSGLSAQIGFGAESTPGTGVTVTRFLPMVSESLTSDRERLESAGIIAGRRLLTSEQWNGGNETVGGDVQLELFRRGTTLLWSHMLGGNVTTGTGPYTHTATIGDLGGKSLTVQVGRPGVGGVVHPFTYAGCKVASWELGCQAGEIAQLGLTLIGMTETTATALATASYTNGPPFKFNHASLSIDSVVIPVKGFTISGENGLADDRRFLGSQTIAEPVEIGKREITGSIEKEFIDLSDYDLVVDGTEAELVAAFTAGADTFTLTANVRFDGETPQVGGPEIVGQNLNFKVIAGTGQTDAQALTVVTVNGDSAAQQMPSQGIEVLGLDDFRRELRNLDGKWAKELAKIHRLLGRDVAREARKFAHGEGPMQGHFAGSIYGTGSASQASVAVRHEANAAFWGSEGRAGWYSAGKYATSITPQFPEWVGNMWDVGVPGQGPYAINPAIFHELDEIDRRYGEMVENLMRRAFPS